MSEREEREESHPFVHSSSSRVYLCTPRTAVCTVWIFLYSSITTSAVLQRVSCVAIAAALPLRWCCVAAAVAIAVYTCYQYCLLLPLNLLLVLVDVRRLPPVQLLLLCGLFLWALDECSSWFLWYSKYIVAPYLLVRVQQFRIYDILIFCCSYLAQQVVWYQVCGMHFVSSVLARGEKPIHV